ncbi:MAG TPA: hypothetical protein VGB99_13935 [Acidobacteriota bacterium]
MAEDPHSSPQPAPIRKRSAEDLALLGCLILVLIGILPLFLIVMGGNIASIPIILIFVIAIYLLLKFSFKLFGVEKMAARHRAEVDAAELDPPKPPAPT